MGVVYSGLKVKDESLRSSNVYISFNTTSLCSPKGFRKSSVNSKIGVMISLKSYICAYVLTISIINLNFSSCWA